MNKRWWIPLLGVVVLLGGVAWALARPTQAWAAPETVVAAYTWDWSSEEGEPEAKGQPRPPRWCRPAVTRQTFLAQALGIDEATLAQAQQQATLDWIRYLEQQGQLPADKAALWRARVLAQPYLDPAKLVAQALGLTPEALQQACTDGKTLADLLEQQGLTRQAFARALKQAAEEALQQAVDDGVLTQEQAEALKAAARQRLKSRRPDTRP